jgi:hypothetical protein
MIDKEMEEYRRRVEDHMTTRRKGSRAFEGGRRRVDNKTRPPNFIDTPFIVMLLFIILEGVFIALAE